MASASGSQPDFELRNNPENKGSSEVDDTNSQCDSALDVSIADTSLTDESQAVHQQDGPTSSSAAITHQAAHGFPPGSGTSDGRDINAIMPADNLHNVDITCSDGVVEEPKSPSRDLTETHTSPDAQRNHDVYQSVPENGPDVLAGEGQQPGSAGRHENDMVLDSAADVVPQVSSDSHQNTGTFTQEGSDHQEGSRYQALAVAISPKVSAFGQYREDSASSFPFQDSEEESLNTYAVQQEWCFNFSLVILPDLTCTTTGLNLPVQVVPRDNRQRSSQQRHDRQPGEYDQARLVNLVRYRDFDADLRHGEGVQESGNQLQDNYDVARAVQLLNYGQTSHGFGEHHYHQDDDGDGDTDQ